jgi:hypothetical protein
LGSGSFRLTEYRKRILERGLSQGQVADVPLFDPAASAFDGPEA